MHICTKLFDRRLHTSTYNHNPSTHSHIHLLHSLSLLLLSFACIAGTCKVTKSSHEHNHPIPQRTDGVAAVTDISDTLIQKMESWIEANLSNDSLRKLVEMELGVKILPKDVKEKVTSYRTELSAHLGNALAMLIILMIILSV